MKALIVDDNKINLKVAKQMISKFDIECICVENGNQCIELINDNKKFDVIFLDIMMPIMDGVETLKKLKAIDTFDTPVVSLTADTEIDSKEKYLNLGFDYFLGKLIDMKKVNDCLLSLNLIK